MIATSRLRQLLATFAACLTTIGWGCNIGWNAVSEPQLSNHNVTIGLGLSEDQISWIGASFSIGGLCGALSAGMICEKFGRKIVLHCLSAISVIMWALISQASSISYVISARIILGFVSSASSSAGALYIAEISSPNTRGALGNCLSLSVAFGITYSMFMGALLSWRILSLVSGIPSVLGFMLLCFVPESPYFLAQKDKADLAHKSIRWLMVEESLIETTSLDVAQFLRKNPPPVKLEQLEEEQNNFVTKEEEQSSSSKEEQDPSTCFKIFLMCSIMVLSRLCGVTQYSYYMLDIVEHAGSMGVAKDQNSVDFSTWASAGISVFEMIGSLLCIYLCDKVGRRVLLLGSGLGMFLANVTLFANQMIDIGDWRTFVPVIAMSVFYLSFTVGFAGLPFVILGEIFGPGRSKALAVSLSVTCMWLLNFVYTKSYFLLLSLINYEGLFILNATFSLIAACFIFIFLPETQHKSLAEVQEMFNKRS